MLSLCTSFRRFPTLGCWFSQSGVEALALVCSDQSSRRYFARSLFENVSPRQRCDARDATTNDPTKSPGLRAQEARALLLFSLSGHFNFISASFALVYCN
ncbi:hypothetical protein KQX54_007170 [Cotesia glomerata]|uniref:Secreted protein n=1 Tax=Cotesia glomerata TaxID=32391 RepID=A0AAV7I363_COTGL|nr:hypothetical protein KQX54_007170 [Cotesia glomerata]